MDATEATDIDGGRPRAFRASSGEPVDNRNDNYLKPEEHDDEGEVDREGGPREEPPYGSDHRLDEPPESVTKPRPWGPRIDREPCEDRVQDHHEEVNLDDGDKRRSERISPLDPEDGQQMARGPRCRHDVAGSSVGGPVRPGPARSPAGAGALRQRLGRSGG